MHKNNPTNKKIGKNTQNVEKPVKPSDMLRSTPDAVHSISEGGQKRVESLKPVQGISEHVYRAKDVTYNVRSNDECTLNVSKGESTPAWSIACLKCPNLMYVPKQASEGYHFLRHPPSRLATDEASHVSVEQRRECIHLLCR